MTLDMLYFMIKKCISWAEGCACHWHLLDETTPVHLLEKWSRCPMRAKRLPELAAGDFFRMLGELYNICAATLMQDLTAEGVPNEQSAILIMAFERGRGFLTFYFTLKLSCFMVPPALLCGFAHFNPEVSRRCLQTCLVSNCKHPKIRQIQTEPMRTDVIMYLEGKRET